MAGERGNFAPNRKIVPALMRLSLKEGRLHLRDGGGRAPCCSDWGRALTVTSDGPVSCDDWRSAARTGSTEDDEGLMSGVLAALRSSSLSADDQQRRLNAIIVELQQLRRNLETTSSSSASLSAASVPPRGYRSSTVCLATVQ